MIQQGLNFSFFQVLFKEFMSFDVLAISVLWEPYEQLPRSGKFQVEIPNSFRIQVQAILRLEELKGFYSKIPEYSKLERSPLRITWSEPILNLIPGLEKMG